MKPHCEHAIIQFVVRVDAPIPRQPSHCIFVELGRYQDKKRLHFVLYTIRLRLIDAVIQAIENPIVMSLRGQRAATKKDTSSKFAELRALKASGKKRIEVYKAVEDENIYEEVDEAGYKQVVRNRLDQNDFVVDDNGLGYADNGMDDWDQRHDEYNSEEEVENRRSTGRHRERHGKKEIGVKVDRISKYLSKQPVPAPVIKTVGIFPRRIFQADGPDHNGARRRIYGKYPWRCPRKHSDSSSTTVSERCHDVKKQEAYDFSANPVV